MVQNTLIRVLTLHNLSRENRTTTGEFFYRVTGEVKYYTIIVMSCYVIAPSWLRATLVWA